MTLVFPRLCCWLVKGLLALTSIEKRLGIIDHAVDERRDFLHCLERRGGSSVVADIAQGRYAEGTLFALFGLC
jgi:hypothetical protein